MYDLSERNFCVNFNIVEIHEKLTLKNLAIDNFSSSLLPLISARAVSFNAGGPVGISIIVNQSMGSWESQLVREAKR